MLVGVQVNSVLVGSEQAVHTLLRTRIRGTAENTGDEKFVRRSCEGAADDGARVQVTAHAARIVRTDASHARTHTRTTTLSLGPSSSAS